MNWIDILVDWLVGIVFMIGDLPVFEPLFSPMSAAFVVPAFLILIFLWHGWKMLVDVILLLLVSVVLMAITQQGMNLFNMVYTPTLAVATR